MSTRIWSGLVLETRVEYGAAARRNRGRYAGHKVHKLICEYIVGIEEGHAPSPGSLGHTFLVGARTLDNIGRTVRIPNTPVLFSCSPACGCTQGQFAGQPHAKLTAENVTCEKCK